MVAVAGQKRRWISSTIESKKRRSRSSASSICCTASTGTRSPAAAEDSEAPVPEELSGREPRHPDNSRTPVTNRILTVLSLTLPTLTAAAETRTSSEDAAEIPVPDRFCQTAPRAGDSRR